MENWWHLALLSSVLGTKTEGLINTIIHNNTLDSKSLTYKAIMINPMLSKSSKKHFQHQQDPHPSANGCFLSEPKPQLNPPQHSDLAQTSRSPNEFSERFAEVSIFRGLSAAPVGCLVVSVGWIGFRSLHLWDYSEWNPKNQKDAFTFTKKN